MGNLIRHAKKGFGLLLIVSSALNFFGLPGDIPTWGDILRDRVPPPSPEDVFNITLLIIGTMLLTNTSPGAVVEKMRPFLGFAPSISNRYLPEPQAEIHESADGYTQYLLPYLLRTELQTLNLSGITKDDPYFEIDLVLWNYASFPIRITGVSENRLQCLGTDCNSPLVLHNAPIMASGRASQTPIRLRQPITEAMAHSLDYAIRNEQIFAINLSEARWAGVMHQASGDIDLPNHHPCGPMFEVIGRTFTPPDNLIGHVQGKRVIGPIA